MNLFCKKIQEYLHFYNGQQLANSKNLCLTRNTKLFKAETVDTLDICRVPHDTETTPHFPRVLSAHRGGNHHWFSPVPHLGAPALHTHSQCFLPLHASPNHS